MLLRFAYAKLVRPNQSTFTPGTPLTTFVEGQFKIDPLGGTGVNAPSTLITDNMLNKFYINVPFSTVNAAITAVTSTSQNVSLL